MYQILSTVVGVKGKKKNVETRRVAAEKVAEVARTGEPGWLKRHTDLFWLFLGVLQLHSDWHIKADYDYEIISQSQGNYSQLFFTSLHCSRMLQDTLMSCRCKSLLQKQATNSSGKMTEFLRAQSRFCLVWVQLLNTKSKNNSGTGTQNFHSNNLYRMIK